MSSDIPRPIDPFPSLAKLQQAHAKLQSSLGKQPGPATTSSAVVEFVRQAVRTGSRLDNREDRQAAQAIINYWVSRAAISAREDTPPPNPFFGEEFDSLLEEFDSATLTADIDSASAWIAGLSEEDRQLVRRVLIRLVRLDQNETALSVAITRYSLGDLEPETRTDTLLAALEERGILRFVSRSADVQEFSLRTSALIHEWSFLKELIEQRRKFRRLANEWQRTPQESGNLLGQVRKQIRKFLISVGKRVDRTWEWIVRVLSGHISNERNPLEEFPDAEFYRDRSNEELDFLYQQRTRAKENATWFRILKGFTVVVLVVFMLVAVSLWYKRKSELQDLESEKTKAVQAAEAAGLKQEIIARRARQRLKELIALVRLLSEHHRFDTPRDHPRATVAEWKAQALLKGMDDSENIHYKKELDLIGVTYDQQERDICIPCSDQPLDVARKLRENIINSRITPGSTDYDKDTRTYIEHYRQTIYLSVEQLTYQILQVLTKPGTNDRPHNYQTASDYFEEFWVLYYGEMAIFESPEVGTLMVKFGTQLRAIDDLCYSALENQIKSLARIEKRDIKLPPNSSAINRSYAWKSTTDAGKLDALRQQFERQSLTGVWGKLSESQKGVVKKELDKLSSLQGELVKRLRSELAAPGRGN